MTANFSSNNILRIPLNADGSIDQPNVRELATGAGPLPIRVDSSDGTLFFGEFNYSDPIGTGAITILTPQFLAGLGTADQIAPTLSSVRVASVSPDGQAFTLTGSANDNVTLPQLIRLSGGSLANLASNIPVTGPDINGQFQVSAIT